MIRILFLLFFVFSLPCAFSTPSFLSGQKILLAQFQDEDFDDSELADIESGLDEEEDLSDSDDFIEEEEEEEGDSETPEKKSWSDLDYEVIDEDAGLEEEFYGTGEEDEYDLEKEDAVDESKAYIEEEPEVEEELGTGDKKIDEFSLEEDLDSSEEKEIEEEEIEELDLSIEENDSDEKDFSEDLNLEEEETPLEEQPVDSSVPSDLIEDIPSEVSESLNLITNIRYLSESDQIVIDSSEVTSYEIKQNEKNNQFILEIVQAKLGKNLSWPYVLKDYKTNFGLIKADQKTSDTVRVIIQMKGAGAFPKASLSEDGNQIIVGFGKLTVGSKDGYEFEGKSGQYLEKNQILPAKTLEDLYFGKVNFSGKPISFHVIDAPIKQVLRFISEESGLNMVIGESVDGKITLKLENIPWDQALYTVFKVKSLGYTREGNVITILPLEEIEKRTNKLKEIAEKQKPLIPFITKVLPVAYGKLSEIEAKVKDFLTRANNSNQQEAGRIIVHEESNTLIIIDTEKVVNKIEKIVNYLDKTPQQVMVEAKIVEASENFTRNFGLNWSLGGNLPVTLNPSGLLELIGNISGNYRSEVNSGTGVASLQLSGIPVIGDIGASLNIAEGEGYARVVSSPRVVTISGKQASITRNSPILVPKTSTTTAEGNTTESRETENVEIKLDVTPTVTSTGSVFLNVSVDRSDPGGAGGSFKTSRQAKTEVLVQNGHTVVIGGIYEEDETDTNDGIPFLKNIPILNLLFNVKTKTKSKTELLVFLTPRLLDIND